jgi:hypothetical protein
MPGVTVLLHRHDGAEERQPDKEPPRQLFRNRDARIERIAQDHVREHEHAHRGEAQHDQEPQQTEIAVNYLPHAAPLKLDLKSASRAGDAARGQLNALFFPRAN